MVEVVPGATFQISNPLTQKLVKSIISTFCHPCQKSIFFIQKPRCKSALSMQSGTNEATEAAATRSMLNQCLIVSKERCPICLDSTKDKRIGVPSRCIHKFCLLCLKTWSKRKNTCPMCRARFRSIIVRSRYKRRFLARISVRRPSVEPNDEQHTTSALFNSVHRAVFRLLGGIV